MSTCFRLSSLMKSERRLVTLWTKQIYELKRFRVQRSSEHLRCRTLHSLIFKNPWRKPLRNVCYLIFSLSWQSKSNMLAHCTRNHWPVWINWQVLRWRISYFISHRCWWRSSHWLGYQHQPVSVLWYWTFCWHVSIQRDRAMHVRNSSSWILPLLLDFKQRVIC